MSEIEKAREEQDAFRLREQAADARVIAAREKASAWSAKIEKAAEDRIREIAREEIEAHEDRLVHEAMHGEINRGRESDETSTLTEEGGDRNQLDRPPPHLMTVPEDALLEMLRTGSSMVSVNHVPGEVWRAPPLPAEVEEMRKKLEGPHEWGYRCLAEGTFISDPAPFAAASLLSRWPGVWRPIETAPRDEPCILESAEGWVGEAWFSEDSDGWWMVNTHPTDAHDGQVLNPTGWMPLPAPGAAP